MSEYEKDIKTESNAGPFEDSTWAYFCTRCDRIIPFEEFGEGNP